MSRTARLVVVAGVYALGALVMVPVVAFVRDLLFLPPLFVTLARAFLVAGLPVALLVAWRYPDVGLGPDGEGGSGGGDG